MVSFLFKFIKITWLIKFVCTCLIYSVSTISGKPSLEMVLIYLFNLFLFLACTAKVGTVRCFEENLHCLCSMSFLNLPRFYCFLYFVTVESFVEMDEQNGPFVFRMNSNKLYKDKRVYPYTSILAMHMHCLCILGQPHAFVL